MTFHIHNNVKIYYEANVSSSSVGRWVTLVNGYTRASSDFRAMSKVLNEAGYSVLIFDNRGSGKTISDLSFTLEDIADDVFSLWSFLNIETSLVLGISMGGVVANILAGKYQDKVDRLILVSTTLDPENIQTGESPWGDSIEAIEEKMNDYFSEIFVARNKIMISAMAKNILRAIAEGDFKKRASSQRAAYRHRKLKDAINPEKIACPTLVLHGSEDRVIPVKAAEEIHSKIINSQLKVIEGVGHLLLAECPKTLYQEAIDFFSTSD